MKFLLRLAGLHLLLACLQLSGCAGSQDVASTLSQPLDSTIQRQVAYQLSAHRVKIKGPVTIQVGTGNVNAPKAKAPVAAGAGQAQDYTKAGQHGGALGTAPGANARASTSPGVPAWLLGTGLVLLVFALLAALVYRFRNKRVGSLPLP